MLPQSRIPSPKDEYMNNYVAFTVNGLLHKPSLFHELELQGLGNAKERKVRDRVKLNKLVSVYEKAFSQGSRYS